MKRLALWLVAIVLVLQLWGLADPIMMSETAEAQTRPTLYWGSRGDNVRLVQWKLQSWGYYRGRIDGIFGTQTSQAVRRFQARNGLTPDGLVGPRTWAALGFGTAAPAATRVRAQSSRGFPQCGHRPSGSGGCRSRGEPYAGQVAVAATILNRVRNPRFPNSLSGVIFQPNAFESVSNGLIWRRTPSATSYRAARDALNGYDPTYGAIFFWNPYKPVNPWIWSRRIITQIGSHVFAR